ncbi:FMN-binding negative transcriptional regulator [Metasolibacillus meyeri]|uniref:FMN-binding negative transcriptional regulator n=1 Tax=Metasolibacillus meyeri TaxID=1071052 RepID=A0AAW9NQQ6_9BACL|nr:FMN-binding negative transcriptional regulator [Metasolibacillus meyeri]MEC1180022.1 FMN-binding negative transcriptional regulator [Metasolibacillus meyeri]
MYIPKYFKVTDIQEIQQFIQHNGFATLVSTHKNRPIAVHLPLQLVEKEDGHYLTGHVTYGNPIWRSLQNHEQVLVMFQGPHAYISSSWYEQENVPTWNYQAVHIYGQATTFEGKALQQDLAKLLVKYESHREKPVLWDTLSPELLERELKGIVGIQIKIEEMQAAYKLSQNRTAQDYKEIIKQLEQESDVESHAVAEVMKKRSPY